MKRSIPPLVTTSKAPNTRDNCIVIVKNLSPTLGSPSPNTDVLTDLPSSVDASDAGNSPSITDKDANPCAASIALCIPPAPGISTRLPSESYSN